MYVIASALLETITNGNISRKHKTEIKLAQTFIWCTMRSALAMCHIPNDEHLQFIHMQEHIRPIFVIYNTSDSG